MVIIARELAVTGLRSVAAERGVVIAASWLGKLKTALQVAAIFALIAFDPAPTWVDVLLYVAVAVTVISGARLLLRPAQAAGRARAALVDDPDRAGRRRLAAQAQGASSHSRRVVWWRECSPVSSSARISASRPERSATTEWRWIVSRFSWRARTKPPSPRPRVGVGDPADHLPDDVLDEARVAVRLLDHVRPRRSASSARRSPSSSTTRRSRSRSRASIGDVDALGAADVQRADPALVVGGDGDGLEDRARSRRRRSRRRPAARGRGRRAAPGRRGRRSSPGPRRRSGSGCRARRRPRSRTGCRSPGSGGPRPGWGRSRDSGRRS